MGDANLVIDSLKFTGDGYQIKCQVGQGNPENLSIDFGILNAQGTRTGVMQNLANKTLYSETIIFTDKIPTGMLDFELSISYEVPLPGPWIITWSPPDSPAP